MSTIFLAMLPRVLVFKGVRCQCSALPLAASVQSDRGQKQCPHMLK